MTKQKVTLTLDGDRLAELRSIVGARSLSAAVDDAITRYLARIRHLNAVDEWLAELERSYGPIPPETLEWAAQVLDSWDAKTRSESKRAS